MVFSCFPDSKFFKTVKTDGFRCSWLRMPTNQILRIFWMLATKNDHLNTLPMFSAGGEQGEFLVVGAELLQADGLETHF